MTIKRFSERVRFFSLLFVCLLVRIHRIVVTVVIRFLKLDSCVIISPVIYHQYKICTLITFVLCVCVWVRFHFQALIVLFHR